MRLVPLSERSGIDFDDGTLDQGLGSEQLVVGRVVNLEQTENSTNCPNISIQGKCCTHDVDDPGLPGNVLRSPSEVTRVQSHSPVLGVSSSDTDLVNPLGTQLGHGGLTTQLKLSLLPVLGPSGTGGRALVARITSNTLLSIQREMSPNVHIGRKIHSQDSIDVAKRTKQESSSETIDARPSRTARIGGGFPERGRFQGITQER